VPEGAQWKKIHRAPLMAIIYILGSLSPRRPNENITPKILVLVFGAPFQIYLPLRLYSRVAFLHRLWVMMCGVSA
jgi:hypothetical protein